MRDTQRILVIEDDPDISRMLELNLSSEGFAVTVEGDGERGLARIARERYDLLVLDLMLPGVDGLHVCREVRRLPEYLPIIIVSAKAAETHRVLGLELGADDYLTKPFSLLELVARIRAVLRRMDAAGHRADALTGVVRRGALSIDPLARDVRLNGATVALTLREFDLLLFFARNPDRVFNRMELLDQVWGYSHDGYEHTVNSHINRLRGKIERDPGHPVYLRTVWGVGYRFAEVSELPG
jgi:DNA-binding response OmpR family regulator